MRKVTRISVLLGLTTALAFGSLNLCAQQGGPGGGGRGGNRPNFDPAQMRERMMERVKEQLEITSDDDWKAIEPLVTKVMEARRDNMAGGLAGLMGRGPGRGGNAPGGENAQAGQNRGQRGGGMFGQPSPEAEALQKAIDAKAGKEELKAAMAKYREVRKAKEAALVKAQDELRAVLTVRQEALALEAGYLN